jgi:hypothetical protein
VRCSRLFDRVRRVRVESSGCSRVLRHDSTLPQRRHRKSGRLVLRVSHRDAGRGSQWTLSTAAAIHHRPSDITIVKALSGPHTLHVALAWWAFGMCLAFT